MLLKKYFLFVFVCAAGYAQTTPVGGRTVYEIMPGSKNNLFELSLSNNTKVIFSLLLLISRMPLPGQSLVITK
jgi:hypothetical protein